MPYLRLSSLRLDEATKRHLADELTATVLDVLTGEKPEWTSVHFTAFEPSDFAIAGRLVSDGGIVDTHLEISAPGVDEKSWHALRNRLTDVLVESLGIPASDRWHVNVKLNQYDPHSFALAGNAADELDDLRPSDVASDDTRERRGPGWLRPAALLGFAIGAYLGYRWFVDRVATAAEVDAAPPDPDSGGAAAAGQVAAGQADAGEPADARHAAASDAASVREY
jgi:phenylpyruvate tautomerase PptA (4-oxalocrotonate tautomerase family)